MIPNHPSFSQTENSPSKEDFAIAKFIRFLKHVHLKEILVKIPDNRNPQKSVYPNDSLLLWALSVFFFRQKSKNSLNTTISDLSEHQRTSFLKYMDIQGDSLPKRDCVDDYLASISSEIINDLLMRLFYWARANKIFYNHAESLLPNNSLHLAIDGFWVHRYLVPHAHNETGENVCPYCLPRVLNRGKSDEKTIWLHAFVTFVLVFPGGFQLPIYVYQLKASQVNVTVSDEKLKQECELVGAKKVLPGLRQKLGKVPITVLADALYANEPMFTLLTQLNLDYLVVRQEKTLKNLGRMCDELETTELYQKHYRDKKVYKLSRGKSREHIAKWFNHVVYGKGSFTNVLRFSEITKDAHGTVINEFHTEWLSSTKITKENWRFLVERGRMRSTHEDMHNSLKNRGFAANHDYARSKPILHLNWKLLMFVAFSIFELFSFTTIGRSAKGSRSWMKFATDLLQQLVNVVWDAISHSPTLQKFRIQFRYDFAPE